MSQAIRKVSLGASQGSAPLAAWRARGWREAAMIALGAAAAFLLLALWSFDVADPGWAQSATNGQVRNNGGVVGAQIAHALLYLVGYIAYLLPLMIGYSAYLVYRGREGALPHVDNPDVSYDDEALIGDMPLPLRILGFLMTLIAGASLATLHHQVSGAVLPSGAGGIIGLVFGGALAEAFSFLGTTLLLLAGFLVGMTLFSSISWVALVDRTGHWSLVGYAWLLVRYNQWRDEREERVAAEEGELADSEPSIDTNDELAVAAGVAAPAARRSPTIDIPANRQTPHAKAAASSPATEFAAEKRAANKPESASTESKSGFKLPKLSALFGEKDDPLVEIPEGITTASAATETGVAADADALPRVVTGVKTGATTAANPSTADPATTGPSTPATTGLAAAKTAASLKAADAQVAARAVPEPMAQVQNRAQAHTQAPLSSESAAAPAVSAPPPWEAPAQAAAPVVAESSVEPARKSYNVQMPSKRQSQPISPGRAEGMPSLALLEPPPPMKNQYSATALEEMSRQVEHVLASFNVSCEVVSVCPGPVITRFELDLASGTKVSQVTNLSKDLARGLSTTSVRVVEVIAGKSCIGLEVPNQSREMVALSDVLGSKLYADAKSPLTMALGHDIGGRPVVADLAKMPHLLVAGTTGSGKSVGVNSMLVSMLFKSRPDQVRMILIDPKMLELSVYDGIPHLLSPVVTDMKEAANALRWAVAEMERRYKLMSMLGVRNLAGCNKKIEQAIADGTPILDPMFKAEPDWENNIPEAPELETLPQIVIVIDELADLMMVVGKKVEELIARLAQKARAAGIHLILATQRPSVDVITGLIKANVPTRMAFQVSSKIDSRTILDQMGAESLLGMGDMLYLPPGTGYPLRVHGAFVDDHEVHAVVEDWKSRGEANYVEDVLSGPADGGLLPGEKPEAGEGDPEVDELYDQAVQVVIDTRKASISGVQRRLKIGYNRAARLVEHMEDVGIVGPLQSNGQREILVPGGPS